ncbi:MAG: MarR family winged helix-turn-helix transcriptional regulator [Candidatus Hodarchaeota archaeon]
MKEQTMKEQRAGGYLIAKIHQISNRIFAKKLKEYEITDINPAQGRILFALWRKDGISINKLAKETSLSKSTLTPMLDRLENIGHLKRLPSKKDRRKILIYLTEKNKKLQYKYVKVSIEMTRLFYHGFTSKEIDEFENYLQRILENLRSYDSSRNKWIII